MRGDRAAMQDVELVDVGTGADALAPPADDPAAEAERSRRLARRRRLLRRWWPLPVGVLAALAGTQAVVAAHEQSHVAARQRVDGVLRSVSPALAPTRRLSDDVAPVVFSGVATEDGLRVGPAQPTWEDPRELIAVDAQGETVWRASLEARATTDAAPGLGAEYPLCAGDAGPAAVVDCVVLDRSALAVAAGDDGGVAGPPESGRLMSFDAGTGHPLGSRPVPPVSGWDGDGSVHVLASVTGSTLVVTAWEAGDALDGEPRWRTRVPVDPALLTREALTYPPSVDVDRGRVIVQGALGAWVLSAGDGELESAGSQLLHLTRSGHLTAPGYPVRVLDGGGGTVATLPGAPVTLLVDDGSEAEVELVVAAGEHGRELVGYDVARDRPLWTLARPMWLDTGVVLLEGTLYGQDRGSLWAVDVATGREVWRTPAPLLTAYGGLLTDGRSVLALASTLEVTAAGTPVETAAGQDAGPAAASSRTLLAFDLGTGALVWATRLPDSVQGVWAWHGDLLGFGPEDVLVLN
ncbi:PQQ-binding-like beta-propeller repeat protein [Cellulomonas sp. C5510]|uniref:outer membrane protein assembly factor BamB family protein n=1 Tax=Cellulomonas sp. C5510 TaxID=2871170 RepID=UPI001C985F8B|nr:PQQ-binding-like beta-propeller repeat protein [Cellulomonas sp. C5510]QZN86089.1 PQQ-binding-like beta-propeller repeat protein [Cellulomonas sp. C5510]